MANASAALQIELSAEAVSDVRKAPAYGLSCLQEVLRLREAADDEAGVALALGRKPQRNEQIPILPAERLPQSLQAFADAFLWLAQEPLH